MSANIVYQKILPMGQFATYDRKPDMDLVRTKQVHSSSLATFKGPSLEATEVDGVAFKCATLRTKKVSVAVTTADCMPVLFLGDEMGVFLHAGWRGLAAGILTNPIIPKTNPWYAFIGPSINLESFEVKKDFEEYFPEKEFFHTIDGKSHFDLQAKAAKDIHLAYPGIKLEIARECTFRHRQFHSWRRDKTKERNWNIFSL